MTENNTPEFSNIYIITSFIMVVKRKMTRERFLKVYANLPEPERYQIIAIVDNKTYSWNIAYQEITNNTELGKKILEKIEMLGLL